MSFKKNQNDLIIALGASSAQSKVEDKLKEDISTKEVAEDILEEMIPLPEPLSGVLEVLGTLEKLEEIAKIALSQGLQIKIIKQNSQEDSQEEEEEECYL